MSGKDEKNLKNAIFLLRLEKELLEELKRIARKRRETFSAYTRRVLWREVERYRKKEKLEELDDDW